MDRKQWQGALAVSLLALAAATVPQSFSQTGNNDEMTKILAADQKDREGSLNQLKSQWEQTNTRDAQRREQVRKLLDSGALVTGEDFEHASLVFQHGNRPEDYLMAHILAMTALVRGNAKARWISAATLDRYLQSIKQPQVFGAQYSMTETADGRSATQDPYNRDLISDAVRKEFCISSLADQNINLKAFSEGKDVLPHAQVCP